jgi:phosphohistidine phosphatase SixA
VRALLVLMILISVGWVQAGSASEAAWLALRGGGAVALLRHARAPGTGDPPGFRLGDCSSQRNLSTEGREQARGIGVQFKAQRIPVARVLSSRWCRALDTATLAFGDLAESFPPLDSFFADRDQQGGQTQAIRRLVEEWRSDGVLVLVTHQVNITALTGIFPAEGEVLVLKPKAGAGFEVAGRIRL